MDKSTIYLPEDLKQAVKRLAAERGVSEAEVIREAVRAVVAQERPRPRGCLFQTEASLADHTDELLAGFGDR